jgi:hypothetical protein
MTFKEAFLRIGKISIAAKWIFSFDSTCLAAHFRRACGHFATPGIRVAL